MFPIRMLPAILVLHHASVTIAKPATAGSQATCTCGIPNRSNRIQGGTETEKNEYPWHAGLVISGRIPHCGASVISNQHVLTAARCCSGLDLTTAQVLLREHNTLDKLDGQMLVGVTSATIHPQFDRTNSKYDLCVVKLAAPLDFAKLSNLVAPACLPKNKNNLYIGQTGIVSGWGRVGPTGVSWLGPPSPKLLETTANIVGNTQCPTGGSHSSMLCTAPSSSGPCLMDKGDPLTVKDANSRYELVGVVSAVGGWRRFGGLSRTPLCIGRSRVYSRVTEALSWINQQTAGSTTCP